MVCLLTIATCFIMVLLMNSAETIAQNCSVYTVSVVGGIPKSKIK